MAKWTVTSEDGIQVEVEATGVELDNTSNLRFTKGGEPVAFFHRGAWSHATKND